MNIIGIIPARYASSRFPGKALADIGGKSMIQRVYEQSLKASVLSKVIVATDDDRIYNHVKSFGGNVVMTSVSHKSGTDRCYEAMTKETTLPDIVVNIQGDEPFIHPLNIELLAGCFDDASTEIASLAIKIEKTDELENPNTVKVIFSGSQNAIYFSRYPIPYFRSDNDASKKITGFDYYKHIGIYAYTASALKKITMLQPSALELAESLEQLRFLENDMRIKLALTKFDSNGIDTPDDLRKITAQMLP